MTFRRAKGSTLFIFGVILLVFVLGLYYHNHFFWAAIVFFLLWGYYVSTRFEIHDGILTKYTFFIIRKDLEIISNGDQPLKLVGINSR
ncbi:hypothetical protein PALU110988_18970 [Paenibacillus lupini]|uniref:hypothetical protein n=1 Tax=Paenibacillus lupini TaxID=1450204 RepID=UPI001422A0C2|nr:hypothetical protein [Paenibacillus lupini]NIK24272.1 hypothetical protein [Paenibacillus lupini]